MKTTLIICILLCSISSFGQELKHYAKNKALEKTNKALPVYHVIDYTLIDGSQNITLNEDGLYIRSDSSLLTGIVYLYLTTSDDPESVYGWYNGIIINGKKEGGWRKEIYAKRKKSVLVQEMKYKNGLLDGDFYVYDIYGNTLPLINNQQVKNHTTSFFRNGNGTYVDFYYEDGALKEEGKLRRGRKLGQWHLYDKQGNVLKVETYDNGFCINY
ncbi:toxin-antitoxin system YwqK family antitoxin [Saccharicrinis fermentans]|uniref:MORN repeat variant n=1 Tax=Saccharicrinis fermentans DSM 9555 = JCM 21142 TaxID=869213 RepID=W7YML5_9BACT|nr:hypothetical protein [Saccharicrinis fermentans]GAF05916.1 hypothetical protein JCM21142_124675 [Saccharicrinis fermentans DSM 9555 = JCM 21142]